MRFSDEDAEEIVQDTLLGLFVGRETFRSDSASDHSIGSMVATSTLELDRGARHRTRLRRALAHAAVTDRADREWSGQPDERLLSTELAAHADAAVHNLPGWCRDAFWLRAMEGQSAKQVGAKLDMTPTMVDGVLLHARRLIADHLRR